MQNRQYISSVAILFLFLSVICLNAQVVIHKNLNIEDGLVYSQVLYIHEDHQGYMWFGTSSGISRWDGITFKNFILPENLSDNSCKWIAEFPDGTLFFSTRKGIVEYKNDRFTKIPNTPPQLNHWIHSMMVSEDNHLFIATDTSGLWIYDGQSFSNINTDNGLPSNSVQALAKGSNEKMYIGITADTLFEYQNNNLEPIKIKGIPIGLEVSFLYEDERQALWIGTQTDGVYIYDKGNIKRLSTKNGLPGSTITQITSGKINQVFVATDNGLAIIENYRLVLVLNEKNGLSNNWVWFVNHDHNGIFYIGTDGGGVDIYRPELFQTINTDCGLPDNTVWSICETQDHDFYFGTDFGLAKYGKNDINVINTSSGLSDDMVLCLHEASDGKIYVGTNEQGVDVIDQGKIRNINKKQGLIGPSIWTINEDLNGLIYFGTYDEGVNVWNGQKIVDIINTNNGIASNAIVSSYRSKDGSLFFGTDGGGAFRVKNGKVDSLLLKGNTIWSFHEDKKGNFYFGTNDRGMIYFRDGKWDTLSINDGLSHNSILGILEDDQGKFYLTADNGLNIVEFGENGYHIRKLGKSDGLASNECNMGAYYKDSQGYLWFGTVNGVSRFDPNLCIPNTNPPILHLNRFQLFDQDLPVKDKDKQWNFGYNENYFKFAFIGIDLCAPQKVKYKYRLSGIDKDWIQTNNPTVQYTSLNDRDYIFEVMAGNEWGYWSEPTQLSFTITPPIWERWWFILLSFLIVISPVVVVIRLRIHKMLALERLRAKIAADLHDDIGAGLSEINILSAVATAKTPEETKSILESELNKIGATARSLIENMSDIVWLINPKKDALTDLISRLKDSFSDLFEAKGIQFSTENEDTLQKVHLEMEYRQHLFMILKEAIHNAIKYSDASEICLCVHLNGKTLSIQLRDNGKGFDTNHISSGNGLHNMKARAEKIGGQVTITSDNRNGTVIEFNGKV